MKLKIRKAEVGDFSFILSTWLKSYKRDSPITWAIWDDLFFKYHQPIIKKILTRETCHVNVCCDSETPELVFGYIVFEGKVVHYTFVKTAFRREGVMHFLLRESGLPKDLDGCEYTHFTNASKGMWQTGKLKANYNPYKMGE